MNNRNKNRTRILYGEGNSLLHYDDLENHTEFKIDFSDRTVDPFRLIDLFYVVFPFVKFCLYAHTATSLIYFWQYP